MNIYKKALYMTIGWFVLATLFASLFLPLDIKRYVNYYDVIATMWFAVIFGYYSRMWHEIIEKVFPKNELQKNIADKSDLYQALEKIDEGNLGSARNFIERYINSH